MSVSGALSERVAPAHRESDAADWPSPPVSIVVLTLNEEDNIGPCLESCAWCGDVHVLDSGSTDRTQEIARSMGAVVHENPFESFGAQRNWAIDNIPLENDWVFHLDADERFLRPLVKEMDALIARSPEEAGFYVPSKLMFMGRWLKRTGGYPTYQMRLFHKRRMRFQDYGHGQRELTEGAIGALREPYLHFNFSKGLDEWFDKHNRYSAAEARQAIEEANAPIFGALRDLAARDSVRRRRALKSLAYRLPARPTLWMIYLMVFRLGFLDGRAGYNYARLRAIYESMTAAKLAVLRSETTRRRAERPR